MNENNPSIDKLVNDVILAVKSFFLFSWTISEQIKLHYGRQTGGFILLGVAFAVYLIVSRARFYRNNAAGIEGFSSFTTLFLIRIAEAVLQVVAFLCFAYGSLMLVSYYGGYAGDVRKQETSDDTNGNTCTVNVAQYDEYNKINAQARISINQIALTGKRFFLQDKTVLDQVVINSGHYQGVMGFVGENEYNNERQQCEVR